MSEPPVPLVVVDGVSKHFPIGGLFHRRVVKAVDDVSFRINERETFGLVGESGSGKSTIGRVLVGLLPATAGSVTVGGRNLDQRGHRAKHAIWRDMQMVFQDPYSSLNPKMTIRDTLAEPLINFAVARGAAADALIRQTIEACGLSRSSLDRYPSEFSGGQRQRVGIARALILRPKFIIADEPVSALDVSIQAQIINLLQDLKSEFGLTYLFIAHDLAVVRHVSDQLAVMYRGKVVEAGRAPVIYAAPQHPYTQLLIRSIPIPDVAREAERLRTVTRAALRPNSAEGCPFIERCPVSVERCGVEAPDLLPVADGRKVACHLAHAEAN